MLKNYKEQKDMEERHRRNRKNVKGADKVFRKQMLKSLDPLLQLNWRRTKNIKLRAIIRFLT
jgi:hypothetical protein